MVEDKQVFKKSRIFFSLLFGVSMVLILSNFFGFRPQAGIFLVNPIHDIAFESSESVNSFFGVFGEMKNLRGEYNDLKIEYLVLQGQSGLVTLSQEKNAVLKKQLDLEENEKDLVLAEVLYQDMALRMENLVLNKGEDEGIQKGDIVLIGDVYIGTIVEVNPKTSKVRLPTSRASSLKVMILTGEDGDLDSTFLNGIALGYANRVRVENIEMVDGLEEGNSIVVNDPKIGRHLFLGEVGVVDDDPTQAYRSCGVKLPLNYQGLKYVFVERR